MGSSAFAHQLNATLAGSPPEPYLRMFDELNRVETTSKLGSDPAARLVVSVQVEPGFPAEIGQQFNIVVPHPRPEVSDTRSGPMSHRRHDRPRLFRRGATS